MRYEALRFPRLYAAASLKQRVRRGGGRERGQFSAALCRGLIEADQFTGIVTAGREVFRGFMPRPH